MLAKLTLESCPAKEMMFPEGAHFTAWTHPEEESSSRRSSPKGNLEPKGAEGGLLSTPLMTTFVNDNLSFPLLLSFVLKTFTDGYKQRTRGT